MFLKVKINATESVKPGDRIDSLCLNLVQGPTWRLLAMACITLATVLSVNLVNLSLVSSRGLFLLSEATAQDSDLEESVEEDVSNLNGGDASSLTGQSKPGKFRESLRERAQEREGKREIKLPNDLDKDIDDEIGNETEKDVRTNSASRLKDSASNPHKRDPSIAPTQSPLTSSAKKTTSDLQPPKASPAISLTDRSRPSRSVQSELQGESRLIYRIFSSEFTPQKARFVVSFVDGTTRLETATVISLGPANSAPSLSDSGSAGSSLSEWAIGARIFPPPGLEISQVAGIIYGDSAGSGNPVKLLEPRRWSQEQDSLLAESSDELRTLIKRAEAKIKDLEQIQRNQNEELRRLRSDLDILVNSGKIKDYRGDLQKAESTLRQVTDDIRSLTQLLATSGKQTATPRNFQQREADLIATNLELEKALKDEEGRFYEERSKQVAISPERRKMLADIGRGANLETLKRDLAALVLKRSKLESGESEGE